MPSPDRQPHYRFYSGFLLNLVTEINLRLPRWDSSLSLKIQTLGALRYNKVCKSLAAQGICPLSWLLTGNHQSTLRMNQDPISRHTGASGVSSEPTSGFPAAYLCLLPSGVRMEAKGTRIKGAFFSGDPQYLGWALKSSNSASLATGTQVLYIIVEWIVVPVIDFLAIRILFIVQKPGNSGCLICCRLHIYHQLTIRFIDKSCNLSYICSRTCLDSVD